MKRPHSRIVSWPLSSLTSLPAQPEEYSDPYPALEAHLQARRVGHTWGPWRLALLGRCTPMAFQAQRQISMKHAVHVDSQLPLCRSPRSQVTYSDRFIPSRAASSRLNFSVFDRETATSDIQKPPDKDVRSCFTIAAAD